MSSETQKVDERDRRIADLERRLSAVEARFDAHRAGNQYLPRFGSHAHGWINPDGCFGSGGLTLTPVAVRPPVIGE